MDRPVTRRGVVVALAGLSAGCLSSSAPAADESESPSATPTSPPPTTMAAWREKLDDEVRERMETQDTVRIIAVVRSTDALEPVGQALRDAGATDVRTIESVPGVAAAASPEAIEAIAKRDDVESVRYDQTMSGS